MHSFLTYWECKTSNSRTNKRWRTHSITKYGLDVLVDKLNYTKNLQNMLNYSYTYTQYFSGIEFRYACVCDPCFLMVLINSKMRTIKFLNQDQTYMFKKITGNESKNRLSKKAEPNFSFIYYIYILRYYLYKFLKIPFKLRFYIFYRIEGISSSIGFLWVSTLLSEILLKILF